MPEFRTVIGLEESHDKILYDSVLMFLGSCFSENIGERFIARQFNAVVNPFGTLYNPASVSKAIELLIENRNVKEDELFLHRGVWNSFSHHSRYSGQDKNKVLSGMNQDLSQAHEMLKKAGFLFVTLGTAWVYELKETGNVVANCHKLPSSYFKRYRQDVHDVTGVLSEMIGKVKVFNPDVKIVFTVSPVRHWKDGAHGNQLSKAVLLLAVDELITKHKDVFYFPAYELVMDDLRDYRFYEEDMLHPDKVAVDYIWQRLQDVYFAEKTKTFAGEIEKLINAKEHRPFNVNGEEYKKFAEKMLKKTIEAARRYPGVNLDGLVHFFKNRIQS
ncbi:MAG: GSCFA domain-containing protein [Chlorobi bacterium]|nr:GSCFA domain-containing protein [Chlorobiota bacterium]